MTRKTRLLMLSVNCVLAVIVVGIAVVFPWSAYFGTEHPSGGPTKPTASVPANPVTPVPSETAPAEEVADVPDGDAPPETSDIPDPQKPASQDSGDGGGDAAVPPPSGDQGKNSPEEDGDWDSSWEECVSQDDWDECWNDS